MKVAILAAGKGSRLGDPLLPKPLTPLSNGISILGWQLRHLAHIISLDRVLVVVGYHKEMILEAFPNLLYVYNPRFSEENTSKSLLRALRKVDDDLLWLNGDVVFHPEVIQSFIKANQTGMVVNVGPTGEEEVKYRTGPTGSILEVSKKIEAPEGEALGINFFKKEDLSLLEEGLASCLDLDYFEKGIELAIEKGLRVTPFPVANTLCTEVDFAEDLSRANALLQRWKIP